jgi:hypothetical protein
MKLLGSNNVIVTPLVEQKEEKAKDEGTKEPKKVLAGPDGARRQGDRRRGA